ncbi:calmodulin-lysine N-methyltransferase-like [Branchiostoma lanceolatum]|uniref:calmodulin-lysine N-methyltransferase-like n=1 Tax=Branchiostoma lanceolatum TaxID=7740 RepID=UPI0034541D60
MASSQDDGSSGCRHSDCPSLSARRVVTSAARERWKLLGRALKQRATNGKVEAISVRRFESFGLLKTRKAKLDDSILTEREGANKEDAKWFEYTCDVAPNFKMDIRQLGGSFTYEALIGFNNTGNVCIWPSEEVLTYYCLKNKEIFRDQTVCELGGGMTCLAGVAVAIASEAEEVVLTDGNEKSVENVDQILQRNSAQFGDTKVSCQVLKWDEQDQLDRLAGVFDHVICADCLFFDQYRRPLVDCIFRILKPNGVATIFAPRRNQTLEDFCRLAEPFFRVTTVENHEEILWALHLKLQAEDRDRYNPDIHYPIMLTLTKQ